MMICELIYIVVFIAFIPSIIELYKISKQQMKFLVMKNLIP